jgi:hypothetical protein
LWRKRG